MTITEFTFEGPENKAYDFKVTAVESANRHKAIIDYQISGAAEFGARITFDFQQHTLTMTGIQAGAISFVSCVTACGLGHLAQEIMDCWRQGHRTPKALVKCLRAKGYDITKGLVACAFGCLAA
jgi:hypothetical protein